MPTPSGWSHVKLEDVVRPARNTLRPGQFRELPYLGLDSVESTTTRILATRSSAQVQSASVHFLPGHTLYGRLRPYLNKVCTPDFEGIGSGEFIVFPPTSALAPGFLKYLLNQPEFVTFTATLDTGDRPRVNWDQIKAFEFDLPPRPGQERIVAALEEEFSRLDAALALLAPLQPRLTALGDAAYAECDHPVFPKQRWGDIGQSQNGHAFPSGDYSEVGVRLLRPGNLHPSGSVEWNSTNTRCLPSRYADHFSSYLVGPNEVVMNLTAQSLKDRFLGRVCLTAEGDRCLLNQRIARLRPPEDLNSRFLMYALKAPRFRRFVDSLNSGSLIQHMFTKQLDAYSVPLPTLEEQVAAVERADRILEAVETVERSIRGARDRTTTLRSAILSSAFDGSISHNSRVA